MRRKGVAAKRADAIPQAEMSQYIFTFELLRQYPNVRTYMLKQPLQKSFKDQVSELLGGKKR
jgi:hypothetical protein